MTPIAPDPRERPGSPGVSGYETLASIRTQWEPTGTLSILNVPSPAQPTTCGAPCTAIWQVLVSTCPRGRSLAMTLPVTEPDGDGGRGATNPPPVICRKLLPSGAMP